MRLRIDRTATRFPALLDAKQPRPTRWHMFEEKREAVTVIEGHLILFVAEPDHEAATIPKLYVMTVHQALGFDSGLVIVTADQRHTSYEVPIRAKDIDPISQQWATETRGYSSEKLGL
jgi:hypothetical protein